MTDNFAALAAKAVKEQDFVSALGIYANWYAANPAYFHNTISDDSVRETHISNAANLARKKLYDNVLPALGVSDRIDKAVHFYFGLKTKSFSNLLQQPAFFYVPGLTAKPFYEVKEVTGLSEFIKSLQPFKKALSELSQKSFQHYVDQSGPVPATSGWQQVKQKWLSTHLLLGGNKTELNDASIKQCQQLFDDPLVANCPPHAAEVFVSSLLPSAEIPEHYGISNIKLTVHIPLQVNGSACLQAGKSNVCWHQSLDAIVFDDSFLHSASNHGVERRDVLIFDVWHPDLANAEKNAIRHFMAQHQLWSEKYAKLAALDAR